MVMLIRKHRVAHTLERAFEREDLAIRDSEPLEVAVLLYGVLGAFSVERAYCITSITKKTANRDAGLAHLPRGIRE